MNLISKFIFSVVSTACVASPQSANATSISLKTVCLDETKPETCVNTLVLTAGDGCIVKGELAECSINGLANSAPLLLTNEQMKALKSAPSPTDMQIKALPLN